VDEVDEDDSENKAVVLSLCEMLGTTYEVAKEALESFKGKLRSYVRELV
jgi:hypothetical protein